MLNISDKAFRGIRHLSMLCRVNFSNPWH